MLVFESLSVGVMAIAVEFAAVLLVVGVYAVLVWPLTFMDVANVGAREFDSWARTVLWPVFAGGSPAGYWCFNGSAFKEKPKRAVLYPLRKHR
jgi:hypothetical protein